MDDQNNDLNLNQVIEKDIIELLGVGSISEEEKINLYEKMIETIRLRTFERFDDSLQDSQREDLKKILEEGTEEELKDFYTSNNFDFEKVMTEEALKYKIELVTYSEFIKQSGASIAELKDKIAKGDL